MKWFANTGLCQLDGAGLLVGRQLMEIQFMDPGMMLSKLITGFPFRESAHRTEVCCERCATRSFHPSCADDLKALCQYIHRNSCGSTTSQGRSTIRSLQESLASGYPIGSQAKLIPRPIKYNISPRPLNTANGGLS